MQQTKLQQQTQPLPAGPSNKKPFTICIVLLDDIFTQTLLTLICLIGTGTVFGLDQPINIRISTRDELNNAMLMELASSFNVPTTIQKYSADQLYSASGLLGSDGVGDALYDVNLVIIASMSSNLTTRIAKSFDHNSNDRANPSSNDRINPFINTRVLISTPNIVEGCNYFMKNAKSINPANIHGFALQYESIIGSCIVTDINQKLFDGKKELLYPYVQLKNIKNLVVLSTDKKYSDSALCNNKNKNDTLILAKTPPTNSSANKTSTTTTNTIVPPSQVNLSYDLSHAVITAYPTAARLTPLTAVLPPSIKPKRVNFIPPPFQDQLQTEINPFSPFPILMARHLTNWFGYTDKGTFFTACVLHKQYNPNNVEKNNTDQMSFQVRPIATYYGNTASCSMLADEDGV